jgi:Mce-associated membrane protein
MGSTEPTSAAASGVSDDQAENYDTAVNDEGDDESDGTAAGKQPMAHARLTTVVGLVAVVVLATLVGWLGFRAYQSHQAQQQRETFVQVGRQGALNLTTIDWQHADTDVQRILDSATGTFYDDFSRRQQPFIDVVKKAQATSVGKITEAGLESESGDEAQVLVAVSVNTSNLGAAEQEPRAWRMRISVQKVGNEMKISNISFVP